MGLQARAGDAERPDCAALLTDAVPRQWVERMVREGKAADPATQRLRDVVQRSGFAAAALNQAILRTHHEKYTVELESGPITDQAQSGRCWIFAGLNMVRSALIAEGKVPATFEFSENYLHFFSMLEKSNRYLEKVIEKRGENPALTKLDPAEELGDGGWFEHFLFLTSKYGIVPREAMPETSGSQNTSVLRMELKRHLAATANRLLALARTEISVEALREAKQAGMEGIWEILATHLGDPPAEFEFRTQTEPTRQGRAKLSTATVTRYTPLTFASEFVKLDAADWAVVAHVPGRKRVKAYEIEKSAIGPAEDGGTAFNQRFLNLSLERMEQLAVASISDGQPVWFAADIWRDVDHATGVMHPAIYARDAVYGMSAPRRARPPRDRMAMRLFNLASPNHAMVLTGFDRPSESGPVVKFKNENSWGARSGSKGIYHLYREWFHENVFQIIVHRRFLDPRESAAWERPAAKLKSGTEVF